MANVTKQGRWYHEFMVPCRVFIVSSAQPGETGKKALYYVQFEAIGEPGKIGNQAGPFHSEAEAVRHAEVSTNGTLRWT